MFIANSVLTLRWPAKSLDSETYRPLVGPIETKGSCTATATKSQGAHQMGAAIPQQYIHRYILSMSSRYLAVDASFFVLWMSILTH